MAPPYFGTSPYLTQLQVHSTYTIVEVPLPASTPTQISFLLVKSNDNLTPPAVQCLPTWMVPFS